MPSKAKAKAKAQAKIEPKAKPESKSKAKPQAKPKPKPKPKAKAKPKTPAKPKGRSRVAKGKGVAAKAQGAARTAERSTAALRKAPSVAAAPVLLAGGNPQIAKGDGDAPVQAYLAAMPGWKRDVGRQLDALIARGVPNVRKAVKWNSPFYGIEGQGWFLNVHCFTKFVRVAFFRGTSLRPVPPGESKHPEVRYFDIREDDPRDEKLLAGWIQQASKLPGWVP
jgi:hypothetical protein